MVTQRYRILAVDDNSDNLFLLQSLLESEGFTVDVAESGKAALSQMMLSSPDLVLLDIMMPDMNGYQVAQNIRQNLQYAALPILLISAHDSLHPLWSIGSDVNGFVRKPIDIPELLTKIDRLLPAKQLSTPLLKSRQSC